VPQLMKNGEYPVVSFTAALYANSSIGKTLAHSSEPEAIWCVMRSWRSVLCYRSTRPTVE
jgi:hypothetical protein